jgi:hypothetical protein
VFHLSASSKEIILKVKGCYINSNHDSIESDFLIPISDDGMPIFTRLQKQVNITVRNQEMSLRASKVMSFYFTIGDRKYHMISVPHINALGLKAVFSTNIFMLMVDEAPKLKVLKYFIKKNLGGANQNSSTIETEERMYLFVRDKVLVKIKDIGLKKRLLKHFSYCFEISNRINKGYYKSYTMDFFMKDYKQFCN